MPLLDIGFNKLEGSFDGASSFTMEDGNLTVGTVQRVISPTGTAEYRVNFAAIPGTLADFNLTMTLSNITPTTADGVGRFIITDDDGTTFTGSLAGTWKLVNLGMVKCATFEGAVTNGSFGGHADGTFDGPNGGSFSTDFGASALYGPIVTLRLGNQWFTGPAFSASTEDVMVKVVPTPSTLAFGLLGTFLLGLVRRRRLA